MLLQVLYIHIGRNDCSGFIHENTVGFVVPHTTAEELADIINKRRYLRQKAKESHARRSQVAREESDKVELMPCLPTLNL